MRARQWLWLGYALVLAGPVAGRQSPLSEAPSRATAPAHTQSPGAAAAQSVVKRQVNINTASELQLRLLPGVTPQLAAEIVAYRKEHGGFDSAEELQKVPGLDEETFRALQPFVVLSGPTTLTDRVSASSSVSAVPPGAGYGTAALTAGSAPLGPIIEPALRDVLGWQAMAADPRGLPAILTPWSMLGQVEGHTESTWTPRSYATGADMGVLTGSQSSIFLRAKAGLGQTIPLLDGLQPLAPAVSPSAIDSVRQVVRAQLNELVSEFGHPGGPRAARVDQLFASLLGSGSPSGGAGRLRLLGERCSFGPNRLGAAAGQQNMTNFLVLVDTVYRLRRNWQFQQRLAGAAGTPSPVLRALAGVNAALEEIYFAMDSVFLGPLERQTLQLRFAGAPPIYVGELLAWVDRFANEEGPRLLGAGGKDGAANFVATADTLGRMLRFAAAPPEDAGRLPAAYRTPRVQSAFAQLALQLEAARRAAAAGTTP